MLLESVDANGAQPGHGEGLRVLSDCWGGGCDAWDAAVNCIDDKHWSSPSYDVMDCVVGYLMTRRFDDWCAEGGICFIDCIKDNQGNAIYEAGPLLGGQGGRLRPHNNGRGGAPLSPYFRTIVIFVSERYFALSGLPNLRNHTSTHRDRSVV